MKKIAFLLPGIDKIGGAEKQVLCLAEGLADRGWKIYLLCMSGTSGKLKDELRDVECFSLKMRHGWKDPIGWLRLSLWLKHHQPDIMHAHIHHATWMARWTRVFVPLRVVCNTIHTTSTGNFVRRAGYRMSDWLSDRTTAVSNSAAKCWLEKGGVSPKKLVILPNGVKMPVTHTVRPSGLPHSTAFQWLAVGRLEAVKDYATLFNALVLTRQDSQLTIAGEGSLRGKLEALSKQIGISDRVHWMGFVDDLSKAYSQADGLILSSLWEGLPVSILEASSFSLPVVATDAPGVRDALPGSSHEWVAPIGDHVALAGKMNTMMALSEKERVRIGDMNFQFVENNFTMEKILNDWEAVYNQLLAANPTPCRWA